MGKLGVGPHKERQMRIFISSPSPVAQHLYCHKGTSVNIEADPRSTFNWTTEKVETCDNGALCQESVLIIKSGNGRKGKLGWVGGRVTVSVSVLFPLPEANH